MRLAHEGQAEEVGHKVRSYVGTVRTAWVKDGSGPVCRHQATAGSAGGWTVAWVHCLAEDATRDQDIDLELTWRTAWKQHPALIVQRRTGSGHPS